MTEQGQGAVGQAIERRPAGVDIAHRNKERFAAVLPAHIEARSFVGLAEAAVYRSPELRQAAEESPRSMFEALIRCASLGHRPGTEEFYLIPFKNGRTQKLEVQGIEGYRGIVERMYRSGAVASVIVREVCENDQFEFVEGIHDRPQHRIDWFGSGRGDMIGVYAYAVMTTGAVSRVVILNAADIAATKARSRGADSTHSPWQNDTRSMWWKTAARRLEPWVPTSVEFFKERVRAASQAAALVDRPQTAPPAAPRPLEATEQGVVDEETGEIVDAEVVQEAAAQAQPRYFTTRTGRTELAVDDEGRPIVPPNFSGPVFVQSGDDRSSRKEYRFGTSPETPQNDAQNAPAQGSAERAQAAPPTAHDAAAHEESVNEQFASDLDAAVNAPPCTCGMPEVPGVIHRSDGPCYIDPDAIAAEEADVLEAEQEGRGELALAPDPAPDAESAPIAPQSVAAEPQPAAGTYTDDDGVEWVRRGPRSQ